MKSAPGPTSSATLAPSSERRPSSSATATRSARATASAHVVVPVASWAMGRASPACASQRARIRESVISRFPQVMRNSALSGSRFIKKPIGSHGQRGT